MHNLTFIPIKLINLVKGQKYLIEDYGYYHTKLYYVGTYEKYENYKLYFNTVCVDISISIYEPILLKKFIQQYMELRAVNLILQKITGDKSFTYI